MYRNRNSQDETQRIDRRGWAPLESLIQSEVPALGHENKPVHGVMMLHGEVPALGREKQHERMLSWERSWGLLQSEVPALGHENDAHRLPGRPRIGGGIVKIDRLGRRIRGTDPTKIQILPLGGGVGGAGRVGGKGGSGAQKISWPGNRTFSSGNPVLLAKIIVHKYHDGIYNHVITAPVIVCDDFARVLARGDVHVNSLPVWITTKCSFPNVKSVKIDSIIRKEIKVIGLKAGQTHVGVVINFKIIRKGATQPVNVILYAETNRPGPNRPYVRTPPIAQGYSHDFNLTTQMPNPNDVISSQTLYP